MLSGLSDADLGERLAARTLALVDAASESRDEAGLAARVLADLRAGGVDAVDAGDTCVLTRAPAAAAEGRPRVLLGGHLDTVPAQGNRPGRRDAEAVHGLGAADMKGSVAVMLELALAGLPVDLCLFGREELPVAESALTPLLAREPGLAEAELVVMMEPTGNELHAGCLGNVNATWTFTGRSGHSARPWQADNAIERAARAIGALADAAPPAPVTFDGLTFTEVVSVTQISGGIAQNVIPDRVVCHVNQRYAPGRSSAAAEAQLRALCAAEGSSLAITSNAPSAPVAVAHPLVRRLIAAGDLAVAPKQAWTPVAEFAARGLPAVNFGPGHPRFAHQRDEQVSVAALVRSARVLEGFLWQLSPVLESLRSYPFVALGEAKAKLIAQGVDVIDFGVGEPREETPAFIREALIAAVTPLSTYPLAVGLPELRHAIAAWTARRFGAALDPDTQVIPTLGSKEAIFHLAQVLGPGVVAVTTPGYPVPERGARFAGRDVLELPLTAAGDFLPDLDALPRDGVALLWLNFPNNPTAATAPLALYERAAAMARERGFLVASDEAYSELYFGRRPDSALLLHDLRNVVVLNTLSKRSSMPGYRSGFVAGDPEVVAALKRYRPNVGVAPQEFVQRAAVAAWGDEGHVDAIRDVYRAKRDVLLPALQAAGLTLAGGDATFFLWMAAPAGTAEALLAQGIVVTPGTFFGPAGEGYVRVALVPTLAECERAAQRISRWRAAPR